MPKRIEEIVHLPMVLKNFGQSQEDLNRLTTLVIAALYDPDKTTRDRVKETIKRDYNNAHMEIKRYVVGDNQIFADVIVKTKLHDFSCLAYLCDAPKMYNGELAKIQE